MLELLGSRQTSCLSASAPLDATHLEHPLLCLLVQASIRKTLGREETPRFPSPTMACGWSTATRPNLINLHHPVPVMAAPGFAASRPRHVPAAAPRHHGNRCGAVRRGWCPVLVRRRAGLGRATGASQPEQNSTKKEQLLLRKGEGASADLDVILKRFFKVALPYWTTSEEATQARIQLAGVTALTLGTTGVSVLFNFLGRDFFNYLSEKDVENFTMQLYRYLGGFVVGIPVFVLRDFFLARLGLKWRQWMTKEYLESYLEERAFYKIQSEGLVDNPDQRISSDITQFCDSSLELSLTLLRSAVDLVSFSGILFTIYPPLFVALVVYAAGGTAISTYLGRPLVGLNFDQEAREADFRYGLVRVRENSESVAFYGGEGKEEQLLLVRLKYVVENYGSLLVQSRNLEFFTSFYRYLIQLLPAAVVAPLYFKGEIEFGVINQSSSAFSHILQDVSLVVFQFQALAGFSAVVDRLGEFAEALEACKEEQELVNASQDDSDMAFISLQDVPVQTIRPGDPLLRMDNVTLDTPNRQVRLVNGLNLQVVAGDSLLIMGPSGAGKTSILRAIAGLWNSGTGSIRRYVATNGYPEGRNVRVATPKQIFFMPQRPYMVLGTLRDQLLYPTWTDLTDEGIDLEAHLLAGGNEAGRSRGYEIDRHGSLPEPSDEDMEGVLERVRLSKVLERIRLRAGKDGNVLDAVADWGGELSLGEQQRLAFARVLLTRPVFLLMDESTSALDQSNQEHLYRCLAEDGVTYASVGHRPSLTKHHQRVLKLSPLEKRGQKNWEVLTVQQLLGETPASAS